MGVKGYDRGFLVISVQKVFEKHAHSPVFTQHLVRRTDGNGRIPVCELLVNNPAVSHFIVTGRTQQIYSAIETGRNLGMVTVDQSLRSLLERGLIDIEVARALSRNPAQYQ